jgi:hypothetical protein
MSARTSGGGKSMYWKTTAALAVFLSWTTHAPAGDKPKKYKDKHHKHAPAIVVLPPTPTGEPAYLEPAHPPPERIPYAARPLKRKDLERYVERTIRYELGHCVRDVDVDIDLRCGRVEVEVELRHPSAYVRVQQLLASLPELRGFRVCIEVD